MDDASFAPMETDGDLLLAAAGQNVLNPGMLIYRPYTTGTPVSKGARDNVRSEQDLLVTISIIGVTLGIVAGALSARRKK